MQEEHHDRRAADAAEPTQVAREEAHRDGEELGFGAEGVQLSQDTLGRTPRHCRPWYSYE